MIIQNPTIIRIPFILSQFPTPILIIIIILFLIVIIILFLIVINIQFLIVIIILLFLFPIIFPGSVCLGTLLMVTPTAALFLTLCLIFIPIISTPPVIHILVGHWWVLEIYIFLVITSPRHLPVSIGNAHNYFILINFVSLKKWFYSSHLFLSCLLINHNHYCNPFLILPDLLFPVFRW